MTNHYSRSRVFSRSLILLFLLAGFSASALAQEQREEHFFRISLVPGLSTSNTYSTANLSLNVLGGYHGAFHGFELGTVFNGNRYDVSGLQMAGVLNLNQQQALGLFLSGGLNIAGALDGGMLAGIGNIGRERARGIMLAGGFNYAKVQQKGLMVAGAVNVAGESNGLSLAPINIADEQKGVQFGVVNIAGEQEGTQIGIINIVSEENEGTPIGLLSFVKGGRYNVDVWSNATGFINGGVRLGTESIYNVLSIGYNPFYGDNLWQVGIGIGYHYELNHNGDGLETDLMYYHVNHDGQWTEETSFHGQWRIHYTRSFTDGVALFTGPSLNLLLTDESLPTEQVPYTLFEQSPGSNELLWWVGWSLGVELF